MRATFHVLKLFVFSSIACSFISTAYAAVPVAFVEPEALKKARSLQNSGKLAEASKLIAAAAVDEKTAESRALLYFALGDLAFKQAKFDEAKTNYESSLMNATRLDDHAKYALGLVLVKLNDPKAARVRFEDVLKSKLATSDLQLEARSRVAELAMDQKQFSIARGHLQFLQRRRKFTQDYPTVVHQLMRVEKALGNATKACKWARELYTKYPSHSLLADWTMDMTKVQLEGRALGCSVTVGDKQTRIKRFQWAGASDRALTELKLLREQAPQLGEYTFDNLMSNHLMAEGDTAEALKLIVKHYESMKNDTGYLLQLGRAASRAGEYQTAVAAYYRAYQVAPRGRNGKTALFQAAFMSYQGQDYDGASRKFEEFVKVFPRSGLSRDSQWHLAWIRYLKRDYQGALTSFSKLAQVKHSRRRRARPEAGTTERIKYWMAMSLLKLGKPAEAKPMFEALARDPGFGYYSMVAFYRLKAIGEKIDPAVETRILANVKDAIVDPNAPAAVAEEDESEETIQTAEETVPPEETVAEADEGDPVGLEGKMLTAQFDDPNHTKRFDRARDLLLVGRTDLARQELYEIERRARRSEDRRKLMAEYQHVENFNRASYISEIAFGAERIRGGMLNAKPLWEFAYPRAFEKFVVTNAGTYNVPQEFVWAIMRAESQYRQDVQSPVGAMGLMQIMPFTARRISDLLGDKTFEVPMLLQPQVNIRYGTRYLQRLLEKFSGSVPLSAASYNAGPHRVNAWLKSFGLLDMDEFIEHIPFVETRNYVKKVSRNFQIYSMLYKPNPATQGRNLAWLVKPVGVKPGVASRDVW